MKIHIIPNNDVLEKEVSNQTDGRGNDVYFVDWIPQFNNEEYISEVLKGMPISTPLIIFDRNHYITDESYVKLTKRNTVFLEPIVNHRNGFIFHPYPMNIKMPEYNTFIEKIESSYDVGYASHKPIDDIIQLLVDISKIDDTKIIMDCNVAKEQKIILEKLFTFSIIDSYHTINTMIVNTPHNNNNGIIPEHIDNMINNCCVPLLYHTNYLLYGFFDNYVIKNVSDLKWLINMYPHIGYGMIDDFIKNIKKSLPEALVENFVSNIINIFNKM
jgi:hypothetical protein